MHRSILYSTKSPEHYSESSKAVSRFISALLLAYETALREQNEPLLTRMETLTLLRNTIIRLLEQEITLNA